jgi:hypothetical protein
LYVESLHSHFYRAGGAFLAPITDARAALQRVCNANPLAPGNSVCGNLGTRTMASMPGATAIAAFYGT